MPQAERISLLRDLHDWLAIPTSEPQERSREVPRRRCDADRRGADERSALAADGHQPRPRSIFAWAFTSASSIATTSGGTRSDVVFLVRTIGAVIMSTAMSAASSCHRGLRRSTSCLPIWQRGKLLRGSAIACQAALRHRPSSATNASACGSIGATTDARLQVHDWELRGVPIRLRCHGIRAGTIIVAERLPATDGSSAKESVSVDHLPADVAASSNGFRRACWSERSRSSAGLGDRVGNAGRSAS